MKPDNEGHQTPYVAHLIDIASHTALLCCGGCIERWHGYPRDKNLIDDEVSHLISY